MTRTAPYSSESNLPQRNDDLDEQISCLLKTLREEYHGDIVKLYQDRIKGRSIELHPNSIQTQHQLDFFRSQVTRQRRT